MCVSGDTVFVYMVTVYGSPVYVCVYLVTICPYGDVLSLGLLSVGVCFMCLLAACMRLVNVCVSGDMMFVW